jgi:hypothetical protein
MVPQQESQRKMTAEQRTIHHPGNLQDGEFEMNRQFLENGRDIASGQITELP